VRSTVRPTISRLDRAPRFTAAYLSCPPAPYRKQKFNAHSHGSTTARLLSPAGRTASGPARSSSARFGGPTSTDTRLIPLPPNPGRQHEPSGGAYHNVRKLQLPLCSTYYVAQVIIWTEFLRLLQFAISSVAVFTICLSNKLLSSI
jgi:hypothetical protein